LLLMDLLFDFPGVLTHLAPMFDRIPPWHPCIPFERPVPSAFQGSCDRYSLFLIFELGFDRCKVCWGAAMAIRYMWICACIQEGVNVFKVCHACGVKERCPV